VDQHRKTLESTSWDAVAPWYDGWMGNAGGREHRHTLLPCLAGLLKPSPRERILDIGCGQGVAAPMVVSLGARYVGVDLSPRLVAAARRRHAACGEFLVGDAADLLATSRLRAGSFDAAFFLMSIQDMNPLDAVLRGAATVLKPGGRLAIVTHHPAFQVPRQSGWGWDPKRKLRFRRVDSYLTPFVAPMPPRPGRGRKASLRRFHRPISLYINTLIAAGFVIEHISEVPGHRGNAPPGPRDAADRARREFPLFLAIKAKKPARPLE
jgi:SAM-dependent methyltransferase